MTEPENEPELYREWLAEKRQAKAPDELADRVAEQLLETQPQPTRIASVPQWARAAILIVAAIGGLGRYVLLGILILIN